MKMIYTKFGQFCLEKFLEEEADIVYYVYREIIQFDSKGKTRDRLLEMQKTHINYLLENISKETFLAAVKQIKFQNDSGTLQEVFKKASSFTNFCLKFKILKPSLPPAEVIIKKGSIPIRNKKIYPNAEFPDAIYEGDREWMAYNYICSECGAIIENIWVPETCKCGEVIKWELRDKNV